MNTQDYTGQVADLLRFGDLSCSAKLFLADPHSGLTTTFTPTSSRHGQQYVKLRFSFVPTGDL
jgi:hypothetical protein